MVLGDGARDRGALADHISPVPELGAGVGYVRLETSPDPVRAAYVSDDDIRAMVAEYAQAVDTVLVPDQAMAPSPMPITTRVPVIGEVAP